MRAVGVDDLQLSAHAFHSARGMQRCTNSNCKMQQPKQQFFHKFDIASVIEKAKHQHAFE